MTERGPLAAEVERRLGNRRLLWVGLRGDDIESLADLLQFSGVFSIFGSYKGRQGIQSASYEELTGVRVDPEVWDIDEHPRDSATLEFRQRILGTLGAGSILLPYRPSQFLSSLYFVRNRECLYLGQFHAQQAAFEHKPWVETAVSQLGLPQVPWSYIAEEEQDRAAGLVSLGPVVLRQSRTSGGRGFAHVDSPDGLAAAWRMGDESFVSVSQLIKGGIPVNVGATVWRDGITVHHPSIQLIGIKSCVTREFGYCGNDFGLARELDVEIIDKIETATMRIGQWLRTYGYLGGFGVDFLIHEGVPLFMEVNPRFQGSTPASCRLSIEAGEACLLLEHVAAWLGIPCPSGRPLRSKVSETPDLSNLVVHWTGLDTKPVDAIRLVDSLRVVDSSIRADVIAPTAVRSQPGSTVARLTLRRRVTTTGLILDGDLDEVVAAWQMEESAGRISGSAR